LPDADHLCGLLFQGHSGQKIFDPFRRGQSGIAIRRCLRSVVTFALAGGRWFCRHG
jgi:hypothetical protein